MPSRQSSLIDDHWLPIKDADPRGRALYHRHYSAHHYADGRKPAKFVGPGEYMALMTVTCDALFVWRKFISGDRQEGVNCAVFRNEGPLRSSMLIAEASKLAWERWPRQRLYTYVNPRAIRSTNPGYCFKVAGWQCCGITAARKLVVLERWPDPLSLLASRVPDAE